MTRRICIGRFTSPHGVNGEIKLHSYTEDPAAIADYGPLSNEGGTRTFTLTGLRPSNKGFIASVEGVGSREAAEALRNLALYIPRERLPEPDAGEYYVEDLAGMEARSPGGKPMGTVVRCVNYGAGDILEIRRPDGATDLHPFTADTVPEVHLDAGFLVLALPDIVKPEKTNETRTRD